MAANLYMCMESCSFSVTSAIHQKTGEYTQLNILTEMKVWWMYTKKN